MNPVDRPSDKSPSPPLKRALLSDPIQQVDVPGMFWMAGWSDDVGYLGITIGIY